eukprot:TRINITY_DN3492_c0_g1_i3.p3 TRINITY_DN3492_c0_g1~~TRINITY_DN3492_c0_g1_i3.p3  ORF type:complete len:213 (+),score=112.20 TRINITY_DN3492_c0_g1_i3:106-744(+)
MGKHTATQAKARGVVIDMKGHLMGRICTTVAKQLLLGHKVTLVRCEEAQQSGSFYRNKLKQLDDCRKAQLTNPKNGPFKQRAPNTIITRMIRGMLTKQARNKCKRGKAALARLTTYNGVPKNMERRKRMVCPAALRVLRLRPGRRYANLGRLAEEVGWKHRAATARLEAERKARGEKFVAVKKQTQKLWEESKAEANKACSKEAQLLAQYGY